MFRVCSETTAGVRKRTATATGENSSSCPPFRRKRERMGHPRIAIFSKRWTLRATGWAALLAGSVARVPLAKGSSEEIPFIPGGRDIALRDFKSDKEIDQRHLRR